MHHHHQNGDINATRRSMTGTGRCSIVLLCTGWQPEPIVSRCGCASARDRQVCVAACFAGAAVRGRAGGRWPVARERYSWQISKNANGGIAMMC
jgi:hypothetical protein